MALIRAPWLTIRFTADAIGTGDSEAAAELKEAAVRVEVDPVGHARLSPCAVLFRESGAGALSRRSGLRLGDHIHRAQEA